MSMVSIAARVARLAVPAGPVGPSRSGSPGAATSTPSPGVPAPGAASTGGVQAPAPKAAVDVSGALRALQSATLDGLWDPAVILAGLTTKQGEDTAATKKSGARAEQAHLRGALTRKLEEEMKAWHAQHSSDVLGKILLVLGILSAVTGAGAIAGLGVAAAAVPMLAIATAGASVGKGATDYLASSAGAESQRAGQRLEEARDNLKDLVTQLQEQFETQSKSLERTRALIEARRSLNQAILRG